MSSENHETPEARAVRPGIRTYSPWRLVRWLASPADRSLLDQRPPLATRFRIVARIGLKHIKIYLFLLVLGLVMTLSSGMDIYHRTEVPQFCGACHEMGPNFASWQVSLHSSITCVDCHAKPGFTGWMEAKLGGTRQLLIHFNAESLEEIEVEAAQRRTIADNCQRCHPGAARLDERSGIAMSHERHFESGISCLECHTRRFAHPEVGPEGAAEVAAKPLRADRTSCWKCHDGKHEFGTTVAFDSSNEESCVRCHPDAELGNKHAGGDFACSDCHASREGEHHPFSRDKVGAEICSACHDLETDLVSQHRHYREGKCLACHSAMSPPHLYRTGPEPEPGTCFACHEEMADLVGGKAGVPPRRFSNGDLDLHGLHGEILDDGGLWCRSCHSPHGSKAPVAMIRLSSDGGTEEDGTFEATAQGGKCTGPCHEEGVGFERGSMGR